MHGRKYFFGFHRRCIVFFIRLLLTRVVVTTTVLRGDESSTGRLGQNADGLASALQLHMLLQHLYPRMCMNSGMSDMKIFEMAVALAMTSP